ncbi:hypothetical protein D9M72_504180 [compost metagenome]
MFGIVLDVDEVRNVDHALTRPSPLDQLLDIELARHDDAVHLVAVETESAVHQGFRKHHRAQRRLSLDAAVAQHVVDVPAATVLADGAVTQHLVGGAGKLEVVRRHDDRDAGVL